jgi:hypothetical protein
MPHFECKRCLYTALNKTVLRQHFLRITPCCVAAEGGVDISIHDLQTELGERRQRKNNVECENCKKGFSCKPSLYRHHKTCLKSKNADNVLIEQISLLQKEIETLRNNTQTQSIGYQNNGQQNIFQVNINSHGSEDMSYLNHDFLTNCLKRVTDDGFSNLIKQIHFNPEHPENHNIRGKSIRQNTIETFDGNRWSIRPANASLDNLMQKGCKVFNSHLMRNLSHPDFKDDDLQRILENTIYDLVDVTKKRKSETYYRLRRNVFFMFFNDNPDETYLVVEPMGEDIVEKYFEQS